MTPEVNNDQQLYETGKMNYLLKTAMQIEGTEMYTQFLYENLLCKCTKIVKMKILSRSPMLWSEIKKEIKQIINVCSSKFMCGKPDNKSLEWCIQIF